MQTLTEEIWKLNPPGGLFDHSILVTLFPEVSKSARRNLLYRATQAGEVAIVRRGLYVLEEPFRQATLHPSVLAPMIYGPSCLSFETALRFYGLIPDVIQSASAATNRRNRSFDTPLGFFEFISIPIATLMTGVRALTFDANGGSSTGLIASPARAIADIVYSRRGVFWEPDGRAFLEESLRIDWDDLAVVLQKNEIDDVRASFRDRRVLDFLDGLRRSIEHPNVKQRPRHGVRR